MKTIVEVLEHIRDHGPENKRYGICTNVNLLLSDIGEPYRSVLDNEWEDNCGAAYKAWPYWSGSEVYPVPDPNEPNAPVYAWECYAGARVQGLVWDRGTQYGALRWSLLGHLISYFEGLKP